MSKAKHTRTIVTLRVVLAKYGDVLLSEAIKRLRKLPPRRTPGAPIKWDEDALLKLLAEIETLKVNGSSTAAALREYARRATAASGERVSARAVERYYYAAKFVREILA